MAVLHAFYCPRCNEEELDRWSDDVPSCCGKPMRVQFTKVNPPAGGSPRAYPHLRDEPFASRGELDSYAKANGMGLGASAEKVGGARNDEHLNMGKKYSYTGSPKS